MSHRQAVSENKYGRAEREKALFTFSLFLTFTAGPHVHEEHA